MNEVFSPCRSAEKSKYGRIAFIVTYFSLGIIAFLAGSCLCLSAFFSSCTNISACILRAVEGIVLLILSCGFFVLCHACHKMETRKYSLTSAGITVKDTSEKHYAWDCIEEVAVMIFGASASRESYETVICCFIGPQATHAKKRITSSYLYGMIHTKQLILIDYSPAVLNAFCEKYPREIVDYRKEQLNYVI